MILSSINPTLTIASAPPNTATVEDELHVHKVMVVNTYLLVGNGHQKTILTVVSLCNCTYYKQVFILLLQEYTMTFGYHREPMTTAINMYCE